MKRLGSTPMIWRVKKMMMYISKMIQSFIQLENNRKKSKLENKSYDYQAYDVFTLFQKVITKNYSGVELLLVFDN